MLLRWYRRCVLLSAMDGKVLGNPYDNNGGSFTGPSIAKPLEVIASGEDVNSWEYPMNDIVGNYLRELDGIPHHFQMHLLHAVEILGYKHPEIRIRIWWQGVYVRLVSDFHLHEETEKEMDERLGDSRSGWLKRSDPATII